MVINPGTQTGNCLIGLSADGTAWTYISKAAPTGGFLRGEKYVVSIDQSTSGAAPSGSPIDADGNAYRIVTIGTQTWMAENLKTTKYNDRTAIPNVTGDYQWSIYNSDAYCWYSNNAGSGYGATYGVLYNWYAATNTVNATQLCPTGWHLPTLNEWLTLTAYLGGESVAGTKLKETGTTHWPSPNTGTNASGFTALPGGYRDRFGAFVDNLISGGWWSSVDMGTAGIIELVNSNTDVATYAGVNKQNGFSVRCLRD